MNQKEKTGFASLYLFEPGQAWPILLQDKLTASRCSILCNFTEDKAWPCIIINIILFQAEAREFQKRRGRFFESLMGKGMLLLSISLIKYRLTLNW